MIKAQQCLLLQSCKLQQGNNNNINNNNTVLLTLPSNGSPCLSITDLVGLPLLTALVLANDSYTES